MPQLSKVSFENGSRPPWNNGGMQQQAQCDNRFRSMVHQVDSSTNRLTCLLDWFAEHQITYNRSAIGIRAVSEEYSGEALGVFAIRDVEEGSVLVTIPKASVLSVRNTSLAGFLEKHQLGGGLGLVVSVMHELAFGPKSPW